VFGEHQLRLNSDFDDIEITHRARSRDAFASGALQAASWIVGQKPGFYRIENVVAEVAKQ
jgi:4-hydroxy-tetrahydrodipicolinate reductase